MTPPAARWPSRLATLAGLLVAALAGVLAPASPASAHAVLVSSSPAANAVVPNAPAQVVLTFSESVREVPGKTVVIGPDGQRADRGDAAFSGAVVTIPVDQGRPRGTYLVSYRLISADGHPVAGGYQYSVGAPSPAPAGATPGATSAADPVVSTAIPVVKYLGYAGLVLLIGPIMVLLLLWPRRLSRRGPARLVWTGAALVASSTLAGLWLQVPYTTGGGFLDVSRAGFVDVLGSPVGAAHLVRLGILLAAAVLLPPILSGRGGGTSDRVLLAILGVTGLMTWPLAGHPAASPAPTLSVLVDAVYLASMAVWLGGLVMLVGFLLRRADPGELRAILPVWSRWAALAVCALLLAGIVQALIEVATPEALVDTTYGRLVIAKVVLFALVIVVAAYSRRLVRRRSAADQPRRMRRAVWAELGITAVVLAVSATLVQLTPARTAAANQTATRTEFFAATLTSPIYALQVEVDPAARGTNAVHLYAYTPDNKPLPVVEWKGTAALPAQGLEPVEIPLQPLTDNHATGEVRLPVPGDWQLRFTVRISDIDQATVTATVPIR
jgi:copper transport protein